MALACNVSLPDHYRSESIIAYHLRDPAQASEKWDDSTLLKGLIWQGQPVRLRMTFHARHVVAQLDPLDDTASQTEFACLVRRMLGLDQDIEGFEHAVANHPHLGPLVARQQGLRVPVAATPFEALLWAITGQQISVQAAISIRRRVIQAAGYRLDDGLWCHPDAAAIGMTSLDTLRAAGLSAAKANTLLTVSQAIYEGDLLLDSDVAAVPVEALRNQLLAIRGIGPWTADYTLLRGYGWLDGSLHGDAAVRRALRSILQSDEPVSQDVARDWLANFSPWRALAAAHLWASQKLQA